MLHVWVVPGPGGAFSDDLSTPATTAAAHAALAETRPGQLALYRRFAAEPQAVEDVAHRHHVPDGLPGGKEVRR
jgi:hypothetical protein